MLAMYVAPMFAYVGPMLSHLGGYVGHICWGYVGYLGPMLRIC